MVYQSGRNSRNTYDEEGIAEDFMIFNNTKVQLQLLIVGLSFFGNKGQCGQYQS